ncbi:hypothetical protein Acid345_2417 [Candidatus Koribacter versatilis Ellin345]|uniref:Uncharacterized protein n=1 Tax=Koribacter versatilis (strain Ellin345) TaxID=204669 RepID=Q1INY2_KORVE|nr:hypothetical protein [Candidatus Koribacter versatilis]ABF41418.1 hypothetical protein Acid345_2417 [Candidatus Koribacter versatilis Ellin345]
MSRLSALRITLAIVGVLCASIVANSQQPTNKAPKITDEHRVMLIRALQAEHAYTKVAFPQGKKGLKLKDGKISPGPMELGNLVAREGAAASTGDRILITDMRFEGDKIVFEINGGPRKGLKWYQHISVVGMGGEVPIGQPNGQALTSQGSVVVLEFHDYIPDVTPDQVKEMLSPIFDFTSMTVAEAYAKKLPPKVQAAITNHEVLVGMDKDMVQFSLGRPPKRYRDKDDQGRDYEEWIYGTPPEEVKFVRFIGPTVAMLTVMKVTGEKVVKTEPEVELAAKETEQPQTVAEGEGKRGKKPTLLAPGEHPEDPRPGAGTSNDPRDTGKTGAPVPGGPPAEPPDTTPPPHYASNGH